MESELAELTKPRIEDGYLRVLVVEDDPELRELVIGTLAEFGFGCQAADDAREAVAILESTHDRPVGDSVGGSTGRYESMRTDYGLVICDVRLPHRDGLWFLDQVIPRFPDVPVIMLSSVDRGRVAVECLRRGATDYLVKPLDIDDLLVSVHQALERRRLVMENRLYQTKLETLVQERTKELRTTLDKLRDSYGETLMALAAALDAREQETANHSSRVSEGCRDLLQRLGVDDEAALTIIEAGALLHDIGKIGIPDAILLKPGPLNDEERLIMREHPQIGYEMLRGIRFLEPSLELVLYHQEKYDGTGYPYGLAGDDIPIEARAFAVVDAWDAMTNERPYRKPMSTEHAATELVECSGGHFDPVVVDAFLEMKREEGVIS
ncbi:MAG: response regulator [Acidobacteria bacterium]|nr:response regulator [Acidobacteriota bacterium]